jgi:hypothetical protein
MARQVTTRHQALLVTYVATAATLDIGGVTNAPSQVAPRADLLAEEEITPTADARQTGLKAA